MYIYVFIYLSEIFICIIANVLIYLKYFIELQFHSFHSFNTIESIQYNMLILLEDSTEIHMARSDKLQTTGEQVEHIDVPLQNGGTKTQEENPDPSKYNRNLIVKIYYFLI